MYGFSPPQSPQKQTPVPLRQRRHNKGKKNTGQSTAATKHHRLACWELAAQISVNCFLGGVAIASIAQLLPAQLSQQQQLSVLKGEVTEAEQRVAKLRQEFSRHFDAYGSHQLMQEYTIKVNPKQQRIIWVDPAQTQNSEN